MELFLVKILAVSLVAVSTPPPCVVMRNAIGSCLMVATDSGSNIMSDERRENYLGAARERDAYAQAIAACEPHETKLPKTDVLLVEATTLEFAAVDAHLVRKAAYARQLLLRAKHIAQLVLRVTKDSSGTGDSTYLGISAYLAGDWPSKSIMHLLDDKFAPPDEIWKCALG